MNNTVFPGADESTPSLAQYFSWINNTNEGATEEQTLTNLAFFEWLHDEYGMKLDIYAFDAGAIDGAGFYGSTKSDRFKRQFPNGFGPMVEAAARFGCRLGLWGGPDGFGDTEEEARERIDMMVSLCRDHNFMLFKFDGVCGGLRPEKVPYFIEMMTECRKHSPDLILLNHRLELGDGLPHATTFLWEGMETYIDVHNSNPVPAPHNRVGVMERGLPPDLQRLTEDHGVCISSCVDYWEDDLVLQAFSRCLILAPEIYGNPWLMRDDEFPRLARIYNLHSRYRDILVNGMLLPEEQYGQHAASRGDGVTRFVTLRNLSWEPITISVKLDESIGLDCPGRDRARPSDGSAGKKGGTTSVSSACIELRRMHPFESMLGTHDWGSVVEVEVAPFRSCLVMASTAPISEIGFDGCDGEIVSDVDGRPAELKLLGLPGTTASVRITADGYAKAKLDGAESDLLSDDAVEVQFDGDPITEDWHRTLGDMQRVDVPADAEALYEATCFSADNNALEVRELLRSGPTEVKQVQAARDAFFNQEQFRRRGLWDRGLFDNDPETYFATGRRWRDRRIRGGSFRLDFGAAMEIDELKLEVGGDYNMQPLKNHEAVTGAVSADLREWTPVRGFIEEDISIPIDVGQPARYFKMNGCPDRINEVRGYCRGAELGRTDWRASNLFARNFAAEHAWQTAVEVGQVHDGSYIAVAVHGPHVPEAVYAAARCGGEYLGAARRAPSYPSNSWECPVRPGRSYTYFIPLEKEHENKPIDVVLLGLGNCEAEEIRCEAWLTCWPMPYASRKVELAR